MQWVGSMGGILVIGGCAVFLVVMGLREVIVHQRNLDRLSVRIHVNGTRGKSSVTRLIAAGLRGGSRQVCAKTTGTLPRFILPDGTEMPVFRPAGANVIEQVRIVDTAVEAQANVLVVECMALRPNLQWLSENRFVRATHGVITNCRADHLDVMGPTEKDVAWALAGMVPVNGKLFTAEQRHLDVLRAACEDRNTQLIHVTEEEVAAITNEDLNAFSYVEHAENVALALKVISDLGVSREDALRGMHGAQPDPGALTLHEIEFFGRRVWFVNAFAANDPESTERIWKMGLQRCEHVGRRILIVNCRADRADRSCQLGEAVGQWPAADAMVLIGTGTHAFARSAIQGGIDPGSLVFAEGRRVEEIFELTLERAGESALVMGIANIGGPGLDLCRYFTNRGAARRMF